MIQDAEANFGMIFKSFYSSLISPILKKVRWIKVSWLSLLFNHFFIKFQPNMREQEQKRQRIYDLLNAKTKLKNISEIKVVSLGPPSIPDLNFVDYAIWGVLENKTDSTYHPNIGSFKTALEERWNKMSKELILKACKSFWRPHDIIIEKKLRPYWVNLLFCVYLILLFIFQN